MPEDVYQVTGRSSVKPENLPDGFQVKKYQRQVQATIPSRGGNRQLVLNEHQANHCMVFRIVQGDDPSIVLDQAGLRLLRDKINAVLVDEKEAETTSWDARQLPPRRVLRSNGLKSSPSVDHSDWLLFETTENEFVWGKSWSDVRVGQFYMSQKDVQDRFFDVRDVTEEYHDFIKAGPPKDWSPADFHAEGEPVKWDKPRRFYDPFQ